MNHWLEVENRSIKLGWHFLAREGKSLNMSRGLMNSGQKIIASHTHIWEILSILQQGVKTKHFQKNA